MGDIIFIFKGRNWDFKRLVVLYKVLVYYNLRLGLIIKLRYFLIYYFVYRLWRMVY